MKINVNHMRLVQGPNYYIIVGIKAAGITLQIKLRSDLI